MGITYGDHLIDSGHDDITPEQERAIDNSELVEEMHKAIGVWLNCPADGRPSPEAFGAVMTKLAREVR